MGTVYEQTQLGAELIGSFHNDLMASNNFVDSFFEPNDFLYSADPAENNTYPSLLPYLCYPTDPLVSLKPDILPIDNDLDCYQHPKRRKACYDNLHCSDIMFDCLDGYAVNSTYQYPTYLLPEQAVFPKTEQIQVPAVYSSGAVESAKKSNERGLSAQSVAARQRRRKISEKTQELGKLIPGGNRMNTAGMFQTAFKYIKYMQAQVGILELMGAIQVNFLFVLYSLVMEENGTVQQTGGLETLIASPAIREKLSTEEKCLVPKEFVEILAKDHDIQSNPLISKEVDLLTQSGS
ncbi:hypothetical protein IFM89_030401 [Coptis chinensis]|uniref:BHLH domain-containing protein n=1 Tax=Coptis chinensis TaxID=261450 RepID=A0A835LVX4_9MAGN|nr:hypothetical protein IFM89_030401 [Coptis chinensis]